MDGLSYIASIIAVLQLTSEVIKYLKDIKDAPKECRHCATEASNLHSILINLLYHLNQDQTGDAWFTAVRNLNVENGPLDQYKQALEQLQSRVEIQDGVQKFKQRLLWKFSKEEVAGILARMERLKSLVNIALEMDHLKLSLAIKEDTLIVRNTLPFLQAHVVAIQDTQNLQWDAQQLQKRHAIIEWLSPTDFAAQQHNIITRRHEGTGQWFLDSPEFKRWLQGSNKTLFCPGIPGAGKTMMAAITVDHLCRTTQADDIRVAYLFCSYKIQADQSATTLLAAILKQLVQNQPNIAAPVMQIYDFHSKQGSRPSSDEIFRALQSVCSSCPAVYIIVDALDECANRDGARNRLVNKLRDLQVSTDMRLLFTSRSIPEITQMFQSALILEVHASEEDVRRFVIGQIPRLSNCIQRDGELKQAVQDKIVKTVDGMFLLARLHIDSLLDKRTKYRVLSTLDKLPEGSAALDEAYSEAIKRIDGQLNEDRLLARRAIYWISYAQRLLTTTELCHALAIEPGDKSLNTDNIFDVDDIISVCAGLVTVDEKGNIIRLVHYTTQEYFERVGLEWNPGAQEEMAVACLTYLSFNTFQNGSCSSVKAFEQRLAENAFFDYSARYWSEHTRPVENTVSCLALAFLCDEALVESTIQTLSITNYKYQGYSRNSPNRITGLHLTAIHGLPYLTKRLLMGQYGDSNIRANLKDCHGRTPLSWAEGNGHEAVVKLLLDTGKVDADLGDCFDSYGWTPLSWAARNGHEAIVKLLLDTGNVDVNSKDHYIGYGLTPLAWAARNGHEAIVKLLLDTGKVDVDSKDIYCRTPLSWAAQNGHEAVVKLLLDTGKVDGDSKGCHELYGWPLVVDIMNGEDLKGSDGSYSWTPLSWAARNGHEAIVRLLLDTGKVDADSKDYRGVTTLSWAAACGHEAVVKLLLNTGNVNVDLKDSYGWTPLSWAAVRGHEAVTKLLQSFASLHLPTT